MHVINVYRNGLTMARIIRQSQPLHDIALDGMREIVHRIGAVSSSQNQ